MDRTQKAETVESLNGLFANAGAVVVAHYTRHDGCPNGRVALAPEKGRRFVQSGKEPSCRACASKERKQQASRDLFKGPTGIAYSKDPVAAPKIVVAYAKENDKLQDPRRRCGRLGAQRRRRQSLGGAALARPASEPRSSASCRPRRPGSQACCRPRPAASPASFRPTQIRKRRKKALENLNFKPI